MVLVADVADGNIGFHQRGPDRQFTGSCIRERQISPTEVSSGQCAPTDFMVAELIQRLVPIEEIDRLNSLDRIALNRRGAIPDDFAEAAAIFCAFPVQADA